MTTHAGRPAIDMVGQVFGRLTVIERAGSVRRSAGGTSAMWRCRCTCGGEHVTRRDNLLSGATQSCGCLRKDRQPTMRTFGPGGEQIEEHW